MAHGVPEIVGGEERPRVAPAGYLDRRELPELAFHHEPLHRAERRVVTVVLADHEDALRSVCGLDQVEGVLEGGSQRLLAEDVPACLECGLRHHVVRARRRGDQHRVALDALQRLFQDSVAGGGFYITAGCGVGIDDGDELDARGCCHQPGPATAPDTESCLDYADDLCSSCRGASPFSSQAISSGVSATAPASTLALNSSPVLQPTSAKTSSG